MNDQWVWSSLGLSTKWDIEVRYLCGHKRQITSKHIFTKHIWHFELTYTPPPPPTTTTKKTNCSCTLCKINFDSLRSNIFQKNICWFNTFDSVYEINEIIHQPVEMHLRISREHKYIFIYVHSKRRLPPTHTTRHHSNDHRLWFRRLSAWWALRSLYAISRLVNYIFVRPQSVLQVRWVFTCFGAAQQIGVCRRKQNISE